MRDEPPRCWSCTSPLAGDQRYCLACGSTVIDVIHTLAPGPPRAVAPVPVARARFPLPGGARAAAIAMASALAIGVLAGIAGSPQGPALAARRVVVATPVAAATAPPAALAAASEPDVAVEQTPAEDPAPAAEEPTDSGSSDATTDETPAKTDETPAKTDETPAKTDDAAATTDSPAPPPVKHVFVVALADAGANEVFGAATVAPYLARDLRGKGVLLRRYHGLTHGNLPNLAGFLSGQAKAEPAADAPALPVQLAAKQLGWAGYVEGADPVAGAPPAACAPPLPGPDGTPALVDRNPFLVLTTIAAAPDCTGHVAGLAALAANLPLPVTRQTAAFSLIVPDACHAGRAGACPPGEPDGIARANSWLHEVVPQILASPAYADDGLLVVTFAEARATGELADSSACCDLPEVPGGGRTAAVVVSPHVKPGTTSEVPYDHLSLLKTIEDAFGLDHLGLADNAAVTPFGDDVFDPRR